MSERPAPLSFYYYLNGKPWKAAVIGFFFFQFQLFNLVVQNSSLAWIFYHINSIFFIVVLLIVAYKKKHYVPALCVMYVVSFNYYGSDPYNPDFVNFFSGYYKVIVLMVFLWRAAAVKWQWLLTSSLFVFLPTAVNIINNDLRFEYFPPDVSYYIAFLAIITSKYDAAESRIAFDSLFAYSIFLPFGYFIIYILDLHSQLAGSYYFYYGHVYGVVCVYSVIYAFMRKINNVFYLLAVAINIVVYFQSIQTEHYFIVLMGLFLWALFSKKHKNILIFMLLSLMMLSAIILSYNLSDEGSWLRLKSGQFVNIFMGDGLYEINSLGVRVCSAISIITDANAVEVLIGKGLGATYPYISCFDQLVLHDKSFPQNEIASGQLHLVHMTPLRLFLHLGLVGSALFLFYIFWLAFSKRHSLLAWMLFSFCFFLWLSNLQTTFLILMLLVLNHSLNLREGDHVKYCEVG